MANEGESKSARNMAFYSGVAALLAFFACNGLILVTAILAIFGIALDINPHVQAVLISLFAILTSVLIYKGFKQHHKIGPVLLGGSGALVIILTMYISYSKVIESAGLLALVVAAGWNWYVVRREASQA
ncbi:MAG: MerC domain-containing protein [Desulfobacterales bacterium]|nr:MerC family mercury resistance protein [Woeseia sp.]NNL43467.1 MerC domain-containing protein [Desulfobacterales bacterium]